MSILGEHEIEALRNLYSVQANALSRMIGNNYDKPSTRAASKRFVSYCLAYSNSLLHDAPTTYESIVGRLLYQAMYEIVYYDYRSKRALLPNMELCLDIRISDRMDFVTRFFETVLFKDGLYPGYIILEHPSYAEYANGRYVSGRKCYTVIPMLKESRQRASEVFADFIIVARNKK